MNSKTLFFTVLILMTSNASLLNAQDEAKLSQTPLSQVALFHRCYADLTGLRSQATHPVLAKVATGQLSAIDACMQVFSKANFVAVSQTTLAANQKALVTPTNTSVTYTPRLISDPNDPEAVAVLNKMHNFHRQWFAAQDLTGAPADAGLIDRFNDPTEPALYLTRLLFEPGIPYREVVTGQYAVRGIRSLGAWVRNYYTGGSSVTNLTIAGTGLERGQLWGVSPYATGNNTWLSDDGAPHTNFAYDNYNSTGPIFWTFTSNRNYGGGIIGLQSYIVMNSGFPRVGREDDPKADPTEFNSGRSNASRRMHRRWAQHVMSDLLCRSLPALRAEDVSLLVSNYLGAYPDSNKQLPFRASNVCMSCHASIDPMAATARSLYFARGNRINWLTPEEVKPNTNTELGPPIYVVTAESLKSNFTALRPPETPAGGEFSMMSRDQYFSLRPSSGDLRYRSYDGSLIWQHFNATGQFDGLSQLGGALAATNDLYVCAASRYINYFTGIQVNLQDAGDSRFPALSVDDQHYRDFAIDLGLKLKSHQSLSQLIRDILSSSLYQKHGIRDTAP